MPIGPSQRGARRKRRREIESDSRERARSFIGGCLASKAPVDEPFVLELNRIILLDSKKHASSAGRYRSTPVVVRWGGRVVYRPPEPELLLSWMRHFFELVQEPGQMPAVELAGTACLKILKAHPFREANGRTARTVATYLLQGKGYTEKPSRSLEAYVDSDMEKYYAVLSKSSEEEAEPWHSYFARAVKWSFVPPASEAHALRSLSTAATRLRGVLRRRQY